MRILKDEDPVLRRLRVRSWIRRAAERAISDIKVVVAIGGLAAVILLSIPWLSGPLGKIGLTAPGAFSQTILTIVVVSIFFDVRHLTENKHPSAPHYFADPMDVYPVLLERAKAVTRQEEKFLDVIGITLYTAWPSIRFWLNRSELSGWTVRFTALAYNEENLSSHVPDSWFRESRANLDSIAEYAQSPAVRGRHIKLQPFAYDFMPSLHGYRLGNGDLFYSILRWQENGHLSIDNYSYEFIPFDDISPSANAIRDIFESWFRRATVTPWREKTMQ